MIRGDRGARRCQVPVVGAAGTYAHGAHRTDRHLGRHLHRGGIGQIRGDGTEVRSECVARDHAGRIAIRFEGVGEQQVPGTAAAGITAGRRHRPVVRDRVQFVDAPQQRLLLVGALIDEIPHERTEIGRPRRGRLDRPRFAQFPQRGEVASRDQRGLELDAAIEHRQPIGRSGQPLDPLSNGRVEAVIGEHTEPIGDHADAGRAERATGCCLPEQPLTAGDVGSGREFDQRRRQPARSQVTASGQARGGGDEQGCTGWVKALGTVEVRRRPLLVADQQRRQRTYGRLQPVSVGASVVRQRRCVGRLRQARQQLPSPVPDLRVRLELGKHRADVAELDECFE
jgi:hypothetical protein